jgi:4-aminobutyrate aminotransferase-like enzyme
MEQWKVIPDILTLAKAMGAGMPLGAFISSRKIMQTLSIDPPLSHVTTFGGHPVSCAAALAGLDVLTHQDLPKRAASIGENLQTALRQLAETYPVIVEVRGRGMMIGLEMVNARTTARLVQRARGLGLILGWTLHSDRVIRIAPPLTLSEAEMAQGLSIIETILSDR